MRYGPRVPDAPHDHSRESDGPALPAWPPFVLRARLLTPLAVGGSSWLTDAAVSVDAAGRIGAVMPWPEWEARADRVAAGVTGPGVAGPAPDPSLGPVVDVRPWVVLPGLVDLHVHLPQVPSGGLGAGLDLLTWLERYIFPLERGYDVTTAEQLAPLVFRAMAAVGTTTFLGYGAIWADSLDATFRAAEAHGIRAVIGKVMMDRLTYDDALPRERILETSLRQSAELCERWNGAAKGRLGFAFTPRFAVACSADLLRESASLARHYGAIWQTHLSEDRSEIAAVRDLFPEARDYVDVYDRAGGLGPRSVFAHAIHCSDAELSRLVESDSRVAHCPVSNMFLASGIMPLARYLEAGLLVGIGSDVAAAPDLSIFTQLRTGFYTQNALRTVTDDRRTILDPLGWLRLATLGGAQALGLDAVIGSIEVGKEADLIVVDPTRTLPPGAGVTDDPAATMDRLIFRERPDMIRGAWVRGDLLPA